MEKILHGVDEWNLELAGRTLGDVMNQYRGLFNIPSDAPVEVNGARMGNDYLIQAGDRIEAVHETGQKGCK